MEAKSPSNWVKLYTDLLNESKPHGEYIKTSTGIKID